MMPQSVGRTIFKLLLLSLVVGIVMRFLGVTPRSLIANFGETIESLFNSAMSFASWAVDYVLVGAVIVVPIWLVTVLLKMGKGRKSE
ncbi:MAG TPA: DUF6460 domain-containing protein [Alphaproteobacteria bacterium]|jgi:hypothetical protein|nr:DUF6460 domain-containing protein [Alphaproteobacteria bacterium]